MRKAGIRLGISTHDDAELERALTFAPDYVALGPIYPTMLKAMAFAPQGLEKIGVWKRRIGAIPLVAIGGLNVERAKLASPRAPISSRSSPTSRSMPIRRRARANGSRRPGRRERKAPIALTIAGSDSGGGAGIQADLKTFAALGVYGASVVTALTAQNTRGVRAIHFRRLSIVAAQIEAVLEDFVVAAIKIGMLGSAEIATVVADALSARSANSVAERGRQRLLPRAESRPEGPERAFLIYDPVMFASSGDALSGAGFVEAIVQAASARRLPDSEPCGSRRSAWGAGRERAKRTWRARARHC